MARDHLADQAEREELHADDDQEDAERQQRPPTDRVAQDLVDGQVDEDRRADRRQDETEAAEQVKRPVAVAADERHRQEIEEAAEVALDSVPRPPENSRSTGQGRVGMPTSRNSHADTSDAAGGRPSAAPAMRPVPRPPASENRRDSSGNSDRSPSASPAMRPVPRAPANENRPMSPNTDMNRGSRYSFGYPACPNLEDQTKLLAPFHLTAPANPRNAARIFPA